MPRIPLYRHRYETLWYALCILITLAIFTLAGAAFALDAQTLTDWGLTETDSRDLLDTLENFIFLPLLPLGLWILRAMAESDIKTHTFPADDALLPECLNTVAAYAQALGMRHTPTLYSYLPKKPYRGCFLSH